MESHSGTSQAASTTPGSLASTGKTGCPRCSWRASMLSKCKFKAYPLKFSTSKAGHFFFYIYLSIDVSTDSLDPATSPGTSTRKLRASTTSQATGIWNTFWIWPTRRASWSSCVQGRTSVRSGKWWDGKTAILFRTDDINRLFPSSLNCLSGLPSSEWQQKV